MDNRNGGGMYLGTGKYQSSEARFQRALLRSSDVILLEERPTYIPTEVSEQGTYILISVFHE